MGEVDNNFSIAWGDSGIFVWGCGILEINRVYYECCIETMNRMPDGFIDMVVTSPPYDGLRDYSRVDSWTFEKFCQIADCLYRVVKLGGVVVWVVGDATINGSETGTSFRHALYFKDMGFNLHDTMIYYKNNPVPTSGSRYGQHFEYMFILSKCKPKTFNPIMEQTKFRGTVNTSNRSIDGKIIRGKAERKTTKKIGNVFSYSVGGGISTKDKIAYNHPAIFPEKLANDQIISWSNEGDLVYDPFMGSGTTAKMCKILNRNYIGSEINIEYKNIIDTRISGILF